MNGINVYTENSTIRFGNSKPVRLGDLSIKNILKIYRKQKEGKQPEDPAFIAYVDSQRDALYWKAEDSGNWGLCTYILELMPGGKPKTGPYNDDSVITLGGGIYFKIKV